jgi:DNA polymerase-3 subunit delta
MFYIFHGEDEFSRSEELLRFRTAVQSGGMGDLNTVTLEGKTLTHAELVNAANTLPFLSERRLVIVTDMLQQYDRRGAQVAEAAAKLVAYLPTIPESTRLVFDETVTLKENPVLRAAAGMPNAHVRAFPALDPNRRDDAARLRRWVTARASAKGAPLEPAAADLLVTEVGGDLRRQDRELEKLAARAGYAREITAADVRELVRASPETTVFEMVDALGNRRRQQALLHLHTLIAQHPEYADGLYPLYMIVRQVSQLLAFKDLTRDASRSTDALCRELGVRPFQLDKLRQQAALFASEELLTVLRQALDVDKGLKTGVLEPMLSLEMLLIDACRRSAAAAPAQRERNRSRIR